MDTAIFIENLKYIFANLGITKAHVAKMCGVSKATVSMWLAGRKPYRQSIERRERIEGLQVLAEEWRDIVARSADPVGARERFMGLLERLYAPEKRMGA